VAAAVALSVALPIALSAVSPVALSATLPFALPFALPVALPAAFSTFAIVSSVLLSDVDVNEAAHDPTRVKRGDIPDAAGVRRRWNRPVDRPRTTDDVRHITRGYLRHRLFSCIIPLKYCLSGGLGYG
jgi:hypothetical protein